MLDRRACVLLLAAALLTLPALGAKYKVKELEVRPAQEYPAHQDFQNLILAARPYHTLERVEEIFDAPKLNERGFLPVLIVIENRNAFPVRIHEEDILLVGPDRSRKPTVPFTDVLLEISSKKPLSNASKPKDLQLGKLVKKEMLQDFEHKSFGEKIIAPSGSEYGIVFFRVPAGEAIDDHWLYLPRVVNFADGEPLMFFEFELVP